MNGFASGPFGGSSFEGEISPEDLFNMFFGGGGMGGGGRCVARSTCGVSGRAWCCGMCD